MTQEHYTDAVAAAVRLAREHFETFAGHNEPADVGTTDGMQIALMRWQRDRFGEQDAHDLKMALGVVEELGETFAAGTAEEALDGLGDVCVYAGQLLISNRLAIEPVLDLARVFVAAGGDLVPMQAAGNLAHAVLKGSQKIRGMADPETYRAKLVECLALCIAKAIDDCEIGHGLVVRAAEVYHVVGLEVMQRKAGDAMIPASAPTRCDLCTPSRQCWSNPGGCVKRVIVEMPPRHMMSTMADVEALARAGHSVQARDPNAPPIISLGSLVPERVYTPPSAEAIADAHAKLAHGAEVLEGTEHEGDFAMPTPNVQRIEVKSDDPDRFITDVIDLHSKIAPSKPDDFPSDHSEK